MDSLRMPGRQEMAGERPSFSPPAVREALRWAALGFRGAGIETPRLDAEVLLAHCLGVGRTQLYLAPQRVLGEAEEALWQETIRRRAKREPVAYITGEREFWGLSFGVDRRVLIPRPETEHLVEEALKEARRKAVATIADIGTGSGCIGISLAKGLPEATMYLTDISAAALEVAAANARRHGVAGRTICLPGDLLAPLPQSVDMLVANLPYIPAEEWEDLPPEVRLWEPRLALDGGGDGLGVVRRLLEAAGRYLRPGGIVLLEVGAGQGEEAVGLARESFPDGRLRLVRDYAGRERVLVVGG